MIILARSSERIFNPMRYTGRDGYGSQIEKIMYSWYHKGKTTARLPSLGIMRAQIENLPWTPRTSQHYRIEGFKRGS